MNYPKEIWADCDLVCSVEPHKGWQKYRIVDDSEDLREMKLTKIEILNGKPIKCYIEK